MRLWTVHPKYLDSRGLCALWREALLAQAVLCGRTSGYRHHPQLDRFRLHADPHGAICSYLLGIYAESLVRGYSFDRSKIDDPGAQAVMTETEGQLLREWEHLKGKLRVRAPEVYDSLVDVTKPEPHPMFAIIEGPVRPWERASSRS